jgi:hypothetical protein
MKTDFEIRQRVILDKIAREERDLRGIERGSQSVSDKARDACAASARSLEARIERLFEEAGLHDDQVEAACAYISAKRHDLRIAMREKMKARKGRYWAKVWRRRREKARQRALVPEVA